MLFFIQKVRYAVSRNIDHSLSLDLKCYLPSTITGDEYFDYFAFGWYIELSRFSIEINVLEPSWIVDCQLLYLQFDTYQSSPPMSQISV